MSSNLGAVVWLTGLPCSGKTTLAKALESRLVSEERAAVLLDGDIVRHGLCADLGFTPEDRTENVRRVAHVASIIANNGVTAIVSLISPCAKARREARETVSPRPFIEVYLCTPLAVCEARDIKGHYRRARAGMLENYTGIDDSYEVPSAPNLIIDTATANIERCTGLMMAALEFAWREYE